MAKPDNLVDLEAELEHETIKGILLNFGGKEGAVWLAKQYVDYDEATKIATMPEWYAHKNGLI